MLETQQQVAGKVLQAMRILGLKERGRIIFGPIGYDFAGVTNQYEPAAPDFALRWHVELFYPIRVGEKSDTYTIDIATVDFDNDGQITDYIVRELRNKMGI